MAKQMPTKLSLGGHFFQTTTKLNYFSLVSLYATCLRATGSNFLISIFSGVVRLFLVVV
jgi:hypothetical protein